jgi:hypothetical protein
LSHDPYVGMPKGELNPTETVKVARRDPVKANLKENCSVSRPKGTSGNSRLSR